MKKEELAQLDTAGDEHSERATLPPSIAWKSQGTDETNGNKKANVPRGLYEIVVKPLGNTVEVEENQKTPELTGGGLVHRFGPEGDKGQGRR